MKALRWTVKALAWALIIVVVVTLLWVVALGTFSAVR
jgi:hypothetical protein